MVDIGERIAALFAEVITFVVAGIIFEILYFQVLPQFYAEQHFMLPWSIFFWGLLIGIIVAFVLRDVKQMLKGVPFSLGVIWFAYEVKDWYSLVVAVMGLILSFVIKAYI